jgi:hypothetical protein
MAQESPPHCDLNHNATLRLPTVTHASIRDEAFPIGRSARRAHIGHDDATGRRIAIMRP